MTSEAPLIESSTAEVTRLAGPNSRVIDLKGQRVVPGFYDSHVHFLSGGLSLSRIDLKDAKDEAEFGRRLKEFDGKLPRDRWIIGGNWDHDKWAGGRLPTAELIDRYVSDHPVFVSRYDGHMVVANTAALKAGGITGDTADPEGGTIVRKAGSREPEGGLKDAAMALVEKAMPEPSAAELAEGTRKAFAEARRLGLTTVQDMLGGRDHLRAYETVRAEGGMTARIYGRWPVADWKWLADRVRTACALYRAGLTRKLLFSGGPGDGAVPEAEAIEVVGYGMGKRAGVFHRVCWGNYDERLSNRPPGSP